jgi:hypothetical protein
MRAPESALGQFSLLFITELVSFFIIVANTRAYTQGLYGWTIVTDTFFSAQSFVMFKIMADDPRARSWWAGLGCTLGGSCGSVLAIWVTKRLFGS